MRSATLANLNFVLAAVTPEGSYYTLSLDGLPTRVPDLNAFGVIVLRDNPAGGNSVAEVAAVLNVVQTSR